MLPQAIIYLKLHKPGTDRRILHAIYNDRKAKRPFIQRCLSLGEVNIQLSKRFSPRLQFFTQSELREYTFLPDPLPDAYIKILDDNNRSAQYFIDICQDQTPPSVHKQRLEQYIEYAEEREWQHQTGTKLPQVFLVCQSDSLCRKLRRATLAVLDSSFEEDLTIVVTTKDHVITELDPVKRQVKR